MGMMEAAQHVCDKCGQNISDMSTSVSHRCPKLPVRTGPGSRSRSPSGKQPVEKNNPNASAPPAAYLSEGSEDVYRTHACPKCRRCFKMRSHLQEHLRLHFPDPSLQCPTCDCFFTSQSKLRIHRLREAGEKAHRCHLCDYSAVERNAVRRHVASRHPEEADSSQSFLCPACSQSFLHSRALKAHMKTHNIRRDGAPVACFQDGCSFQSSQSKDLIRHAAEEHGIRAAACRHHACSAVFKCDADMEDHYRTHLAYRCSDCSFSCSNKNVFLQHRRLGHTGLQKLCCDFCPLVTFNPVEYEQHVARLHANEKIHRCSQCSYVTAHKRGLKRHVLMHSGEKPHKCSLCEFRCRDESYLSKHMLVHTEHKNFMCAECGYVTKWKHYLTVHMRKHAGDLRYSCDQCSYRCHRTDQLKSHKLRHQPKSLMCEICAYACKRKYELRNHMLAKHSGEEKKSAAYKCKYCSYTTWYRQALQNHENCKHTKLKEFGCALCSYSSYSSISLFLHKRKVHGYVPGDAAWLENYAAKEKERSSAEFMEDFYRKSKQPAAGTQQNQSGTDPCTESSADGSVLALVGHEAISERSASSPEQYCTLVLTTLPDQNTRNENGNCQSPPPSTVLDPSTPASSLEEDNLGMQDGPGEQSDVEDASEPPTDPSRSVESVDDRTFTPEGANKVSTIGSAFPAEETDPSPSEVRLKALRKHDKDQADAMVLEGRVQMLAVPSEAVYRCDKCSYVTSKETALDQHCRHLCHRRAKGHECPSCGERFKQRRRFDHHLKNQHPAPPPNTASPGNPAAAPAESERPQRETSSHQTELLSSANETSTELKHQQEPCTAHIQTTTVSEPQAGEIMANTKKVSTKTSQSKAQYVKRDGKFECELCSFSSAKLATFKKHLQTCRQASGQIVSETDKQGSEKLKSMEDHVGRTNDGSSGENRPIYALRCSQRRAVADKKGRLQPFEVRCPSCPYSARSKRFLSRHILSDHKEEKLQDPVEDQLHCQQPRMYRCSCCSFSSSRRHRLEEHESLHTGVGRHSCDACHKTFGAVSKLRQHKLRIHDKQPTHFCPLCDFAGYALDDVRRHSRRCHSGELQHICSHCNARFSSEIALRNHCKRAHQLQACFSCKKCDFTCSSEGTLKQHQQSRHPELKCSTCQEEFQTEESLGLHQRTHLAHPCQLCPFAAKTKPLLAQHLLSQHEGGSSEDKPLRCSTCEFACWHQLVLEQHLRSHGSKRLYKCTDCEYATRNKQKITWHIRIHTGEKPYSCEQCSYACSDPSRLKLHMRVHQEEKKYLCPECGYKCKWATQLKYHMTKHTGEKPYPCDECGYRTNRADTLRAHRDTQHRDLRPYVCEKCGKAFKTSFILKTHQKKHTDDRAYACGLCQKSFRWPAGLRHHFLSHTEQRPFSCRHCAYRAKQRFQVVKHLQRHHPEESAEQGVLRDSDRSILTLKEALQGAPHATAVREHRRPAREEEAVSEGDGAAKLNTETQ
uniref:Zinc finger protein 142 n=2 Tax=Poecilia latipinna TaxID=48699 RepID=A0A3B3UWS9_9TELE